MTIEFPHFYNALEWTIKYYGISAIKDEFEMIGKYGYGGANHKTVQSTYELSLELQDRMETEIKYTIQNCYPAAQILHLDLLKDWLGDFRIEKTNIQHIVEKIDDYNKSLYDKLLVEVDKKENEFRNTPYYHLEHGKEYSFEKAEQRFIGLIPYSTGRTETVITKNNKFFCLDKTPEYLDPKYLDSYLIRLDKLVSNFRRILKKYVELYDSGKLPVAHQIVLVQPPTETTVKSLPQPLVTPTKKLKVKLSVEQLAYLFRLLHDEGLIICDSNKEIHDFISKHFETHRVGKHKDISKIKIEGAFSSPDPKTVQTLTPILRKMWQQAAKF